MAKPKLKKYPKKPALTASVGTIEKYFEKCSEIDKENEVIKKEHEDQKKAAEKLKQYKPGATKAAKKK